MNTGLGDAFSADAGRQAQWRAFLAKNRLQGPDLAEVVSTIRERLVPALEQARGRRLPDEARRTGDYVDVETVVDSLQRKLDAARVRVAKKGK